MKCCARWLIIGMLAPVGLWWALPFPVEKLHDFPAGALVTDREGRVLRVTLGPNGEDCRPIYEPRPEDWIVQAIVAAEDERFWWHPGVDPLAVVRAIGQNVAARRTVSGASTISTQVIRLMEPRPRTLRAKLIEAFRALQLERRVGKREVLRQYLNRAPFGANIVGIEAAAQRYFGKSARDLCLAEAALLAGIPQSPARLRPDRNFERARKRQAYVLRRMEAKGYITAAQRQDAWSATPRCRPGRYPFEAPHFCDFVLARTRSGSGVIRTTLDPMIQQLAEAALLRDAAARRAAGVDGGAIVVLDARTGAIRAMVGSPDYTAARQRGQVNGALAPRSAGSTLKPFAFAMAFDRGLLTPGMLLSDSPRLFPDLRPENFDGEFHGRISARDALILSLNLPSLDVEQRVGQPAFHRLLLELGLRTLNRPSEHYGLGLVLGNGEVRLLDLANAYAVLARGGAFRPAQWRDAAPSREESRAVFSPEAAWLIADALGGDERGLDATGHTADAALPRFAWKTGTSSGFRDAWTVAYNPEYIVGVWIGNTDGAPAAALVGRLSAAPVAWDVIRRLAGREAPWYERPPGIREGLVCSETGRNAGPGCERTKTDYRIAEVTPFEPCRGHPVAVQRARGLRIEAPANGSVYRASAGGNLSLASSVPAHWFVDRAYVGQGAQVFWPLTAGRHEIACADADGRTDRVAILVE